MTDFIATRPTTCAVLVFAAVFSGVPAPAQAATWCAHYATGGDNCGFSSRQQCLASVSGVGGSCDAENGEAEPPKPYVRRRKAVRPKPRRKPPPERPAASAPQPAAPPSPAPPRPVAPPMPAQKPTNNFQTGRALILSGEICSRYCRHEIARLRRSSRCRKFDRVCLR